MSRIDELIAEHCPDGVDVLTLGNLEDQGIVKLGRGKVISKTLLSKIPGPYPVYSSSGSGTGEFGRYGEYLFDDERISWSVDGGGRFFHRPAHKYSVTNVSGWLKVLDESYVNTKYLFYVLDNLWINENFDYVKKAHPSVIRDIYLVPVPPLPVQQAIVEVLDKFTQLEAELEAELEARKQQYEHYSGELLSVSEDIPRVRFGDVATIVRGASPRPIQRFLTDAQDGAPWIKIGDVPADGKYITETKQRVTLDGAAKSRRVMPGDFVLSNSMSFGRPYISKIEGYIHDGWLAISGFDESYVSDYLYYLLRSRPVQDEFKRRAGSGTVQNLNAEIVRSVEIPLPPRATQERIVVLLDKFDALVNDLSIGLPAELAARRQQYEYYRDKLLTFKELEVTA